VRLFVAVWPSAAARAALDTLPRPPTPGLRWTTPDQWHVTLRFLGEQDDADPAAAAVRRVPGGLEGSAPGPVAGSLGPATSWFPGRRVLQVPVEGLDRLAAAVDTAFDGAPGPGAGGRDRPFVGHLTVARTRGQRRGPIDLAGAPCAAPWPVNRVTLVRSTLGGSGSRYEILAAAPLPCTPSP
jgi:RNA 2',3'-cyclic 3'-phosphodiesterase